jgi:TonB family protein
MPRASAASLVIVPALVASLTAQSAGQPLPNVSLPGGHVSMPVAIEQPVPIYKDVFSAGPPIEGVVEVEAVVGAAGTVLDARVSKALRPTADEAALSVAQRWTFHPAFGSNAPVAALVRLLFRFTPPRGSEPGSVSGSLTTVEDRQDVDDGGQQMAVAPRPGTGSVRGPKLLRHVEPSYTEPAMRARIQGDVTMEVLVLSDGNIGAVRITKSLDDEFGLDAQAVRAARHWLFSPGTVDGKPIPVVVTLVMTFRLH